MRFEIEFFGHENIRSNHTKTIEITKETHLTPQGDCIVGVGAGFGCADLPEELKNKLKDSEARVKFSINVGNHFFEVCGYGHPDLILSHETDIVLRKSDFVCPRTMAVRCDKASDLLPRKMVQSLKDPQIKGTFVITVD